MAEITIQLSDKALSLIAQLQKEIFNRRRKKVTPAGVVETLVESGAKSQSDKRFATSWKNLVADIEKAARLADAHGAKPSSLSDEEWALVLSHRSRPSRKAPARSLSKTTGTTTGTTTGKTTGRAVAKGVRKTVRKVARPTTAAVAASADGASAQPH